MNDYYVTQIIFSNKVQINTALSQGRKKKLPKRKLHKTKDFSCTIPEYIQKYTDHDYWKKSTEKELQKSEGVQSFVSKRKTFNKGS